MTVRTWSDWHLQVWQRWPVLALSVHYALWLGINASFLFAFQHFWPEGSSNRSFAVTLASIATATAIAAFLKRPLNLGEWVSGSLVCTLIAAAYLSLFDVVKSPTLLHGVLGFAGFYVIHLFLFSPWLLRAFVRARAGEVSPPSSQAEPDPSGYARFWLSYPASAALAHYALFVLAFALITYVLFPADDTGRPLRGFVLVMLFVMSWLYAIKAQRPPDTRSWLLMALAGTVIYWSAGYASGEIHPASSRQLLDSLAVTLLYHLVMFSPWLVAFWMKVRA